MHEGVKFYAVLYAFWDKFTFRWTKLSDATRLVDFNRAIKLAILHIYVSHCITNPSMICVSKITVCISCNVPCVSMRERHTVFTSGDRVCHKFSFARLNKLLHAMHWKLAYKLFILLSKECILYNSFSFGYFMHLRCFLIPFTYSDLIYLITWLHTYLIWVMR